MRSACLVFALLLLSCGGGDDDGTDPDLADASAGTGSDAPAGGGGADAAGSGTQGPNQLCNTLPDGGPYCMDGLECCADKVCRFEGDCGAGGYIPCNCNSDCSGGRVCCETSVQTFCTRSNDCENYGGTPQPTCP